MTGTDKLTIARQRLHRQQISYSKFRSPHEVAEWLGAMQGQDYNMAKWAIGVRLPGSTDKAIEEALAKGKILRTHLLRPTWHLVSADDIHWMLELTAPHIKPLLKSRHAELGLTQAIINKSYGVLEKALTSGNHLTRDEIIGALGKAKLHINSSQAYHLLLRAELDGIICSGAMKEKEQTYALLAERAPKKKILGRDEALSELARRYFTSRGPATLHDFVWWSGLPVADAKKSLEMTKGDIASEQIGSQAYWFSRAFSSPDGDKDSLHLLPAFDEFIISYKDRSPSFPVENQKNAISSNGVFKPVIVLNGQVIGIWKRTTKKNKTIVETHFFQPPNKTTKILMEKEVAAYGQFLNRTTEIA